MSHSEVLETSEDGRYRVRLILDEDAGEPYDDGASPLMRLDRTGSGVRAEHVMATGRPLDADAQVEAAVQHWGVTPADGNWRLVETYLRAFFGVTKIETWHSGSYWYVTYDPAAWREWAGAPEGSANMDEYRAWCEGDVWSWVTEKLVHWTTDDGAVSASFKDEWEHLDSCSGYYGGDYAEKTAREELAGLVISDRLEALRTVLRAETISYGELAELQSLAAHITPGDTELLEAAGVPEHPETDLTPERIAAAAADMQQIPRNLDQDREA